jgi:hypothetical protein
MTYRTNSITVQNNLKKTERNSSSNILPAWCCAITRGQGE